MHETTPSNDDLKTEPVAEQAADQSSPTTETADARQSAAIEAFLAKQRVALGFT